MDRDSLEALSKKDLAELAREKGLSRFGSMTKEKLVEALAALFKPRTSAKKAEAEVPAGKPEKTRVVDKAEPAPVEQVVPAAQAGKGKQKAAAKVGKAEVAADAEASPGAGKVTKGSKPAKGAKTEAAKSAKDAPAAKAGKTGKSAVAEPEFKPAEAYLAAAQADAQAAAEAEVEYELGPDGQPRLGADGKPKVKAKPKFKQTSKADELLAVDEALGELPPTYDEDRAVLLVRDPQWAYAYWDLRKALATRDPAHGDFRQILRVQEMSGHEGRPAYFYDVPVPPYARSWYLKLPGDGRRYRIEVGLHYRDGSYAPVAASNGIEMPRSKPSDVVADKFVTLPLEEPEIQPAHQAATALPPVAEWMVAPESAGAIASVAPPLAPVAGQPAPTRTYEPSVPAAGWEEAQIRPWAHPWSGRHPFTPDQDSVPGAPGLSGPLSSHSISSWGFAPGASEELQRKPGAKDFWLVADAELIVYGATEPDATVTLRGERIQLRPDGTFSFRFYLPDGLHPIPIRALNADEDDERMITITVSRKTEGDGKHNLRI